MWKVWNVDNTVVFWVYFLKVMDGLSSRRTVGRGDFGDLIRFLSTVANFCFSPTHTGYAPGFYGNLSKGNSPPSPLTFLLFFPPAFFTRLILFPGGPSLSVPPYEYYVLRTEGNADKGAPYNFANSVILTTKSPKIINHNQSSHH